MIKIKNSVVKYGLGIGAGIIITSFSYFYMPKKAEPIPLNIKSVEKTLDEKIDYRETIMDKLEEINKLEIMQASMNNSVTINGNRFKNNNFFKNNKIINTSSVGKYILDLDDITNNLIFGNNEVTILVSLEKEIVLLEKNFTYQEDKGWLAFSDVKLTAEEYNYIIQNVKDTMLDKMNEKEYTSIVKEKAETLIKNKIFQSTNDTFRVNVKWLN